MALEKINAIREKLNELAEKCKSFGLEVEAGLKGDPDLPSKFYVKFHILQSGGVGEIVESISVHGGYTDAPKSQTLRNKLSGQYPSLDQYVAYSSESTIELIEILKEVLLAKSHTVTPETLCEALNLLMRKDGVLYVLHVKDSWRMIVTIVKMLAETGLYVSYEGWDFARIDRLTTVTNDNVQRFIEIYGDKVRELMRSNSNFRKEIRNIITSGEVMWFEDLAKLFPERFRLFYMLSAGAPLKDEDLKALKRMLSRGSMEDRNQARKLALNYLSNVKNEKLEKLLMEDHIIALIQDKHPRKIFEALEFLFKIPANELNKGVNSHLLNRLARKLFRRDDVKFLGMITEKKRFLEKKYLVFMLGDDTRVTFNISDTYYKFRFLKKHPLIGKYGAEVGIKIKDIGKILQKDPELLRKYTLKFEEYASKLEQILNEAARRHGLAIKFMQISGTWSGVEVSEPWVYINARDDPKDCVKWFEERANECLGKIANFLEKLLSDQNRKLSSVTA